MRHFTTIGLFALALVWATSSGCMTTRDYASVYRKAKKPTTGLENPGQFCKQLQSASVMHQRLGLSQQQITSYVRCNLLRQQLFAAAVRARRHTTWVLAFPLSWPIHAITLYSWPTIQAMTASKIGKAAKQLEQAYQDSDQRFLAICKQQLQTHWGQTFVSQRIPCS